MEWQHPQWLYLIMPLAAAWLTLALYSRRRRQRAAEAFVAQAMWSRILPEDSRIRFWVKLLLRETALVTGLVALAGPRFGTQYEDVIPRGSDLYVLIDVSRSMLAQDVPPSRLGRAKADVAALVNRLEGERVGLIAFAGQAVVKCPLTVDYDAFRRSLEELDPNSAPRGGTAIGDAIRKALEVFQAGANRDQAILLITDGDDQQSYPLEAAAVAAERHVTIFTVGLGDADKGARIPQASSFVEYQGQQVWSKLEGSLLKDIALKTSGVYVPVGTRAYDLGELYAKYLQGRRGDQAQTTRRIRRADRFQIFLALTLLALLADAFTRPYPSSTKLPDISPEPTAGTRKGKRASLRYANEAVATATALMVVASIAGSSRADNPADAIREGLNWYGKGDFDKARDRFATAREQFDSGDAGKAAIAAFDQACAAHKKGDVAQAREWYLKAGLARDKGLAASAHFNLGTLAGEEARRLAGEHPENVPPDKRPEILEQLKASVASFRHCLELQPDNARARRDIELVRQWIKYYADQWVAHDREKRRQETNLLAFLEFLIEAQRALQESIKALSSTAPADAFAEPKRLQEEILEEIAPLKAKIKTELTPPPAPAGANSPQSNSSELEQGIALLQGWAGTAGEKMSAAAADLDARKADAAATQEQAAIDELEKIWDAVIPFRGLLSRDLADQTKIAGSLVPPSSPAPKPSATDRSVPKAASPDPTTSAANNPPAAGTQAALGTEKENLEPLVTMQQRTLRRTQLLKLKAEAELERLEKSPPPAASPKPDEKAAAKDNPPAAADAKTKPVDPKEIKAGYQKAIELAPKAANAMERSVKSLKGNDALAAYPPTEEARKILEEIQKAQPKQDEPEQDKKKDDQQKKDQDQQKKDQDKKNEDEQKKDQDKKNEDEQKKDQDKKNEDQQKQDQKDQQQSDQQKKEQNKEDQQKKDQEKKTKDKQSKNDNKPQDEQQKEQPQASRDQIEDALRKVRERQQEKRERDRRMKARLLGRVPVDKDW
jgi:Ca-activated chloride channel family protein